jgi:DNA-binding SARP family transcriptional activator
VLPPDVEFRILGPLEVSVGDRPVRLGGQRQRALLAILLLNAGEVVSSERLAEGIWGDSAPASARHLVQVYVSQLRGALDGRRRSSRARPATWSTSSRPGSTPGALNA